MTFEETFQKCYHNGDPEDGWIVVSPMPDTSPAPSLAPVTQLAEVAEMKILADNTSKPAYCFDTITELSFEVTNSKLQPQFSGKRQTF